MELGSHEAVSSQERILKDKVGKRDTGSLSFLVKTMSATNQHDLPSQATHWASCWCFSFCLERCEWQLLDEKRKRQVMTPVLFLSPVISASHPAERPEVIGWLSVLSAVNEASTDISPLDSEQVTISVLRKERWVTPGGTPDYFQQPNPTLGGPWPWQVY